MSQSSKSGGAHLAIGTTSSTALVGDSTTISAGQASAITDNTAKTGITSGQASAITANTSKVSASGANADITQLTGLQIAAPLIFEGTADDYETTITVTDPTSPDNTITFPDATGTVELTSHTHNLTGEVTSVGLETTIDDDAVVTAKILDDNVTAAKLADSINTDIATGVTSGTVAAAALPKAGGAMTGAITTNSTFDGIDIATRDAVLTSTTTTAVAALPKAGGAMTGAITTNSTFDGIDIATRDAVLTATTITANAAAPSAFTQTGTGAAVRTVDAKLKESLSVADFGAAGDGTDQTAAIQAAVDAAGGKRIWFPSGTYKVTTAITGTALWFECDDGVVFRGDGTLDRFISDVEDVTLMGGTVGVSGGCFTLYGLYWTSSSQIDNLKVYGTKFMCGGSTDRAIACADEVVLKRCDIRDCLFDDFVRSGIELPVNMTADDASANFDFLRADNVEDETGTRRFVVIGSNLSQARHVTATRLIAIGLGGSSTNEVKGFLGYGVDINVSYCHFENIKNAGGDDAEAIYIKGANSTISHNYIKNGGHSHDGCITIKGTSFVDEPEWSDYSRITGNHIIFDSPSYDAPAIGVQRSYCIVDNNIMQDTRGNSPTYGFAIGIGTSSSGVSYVKVHDNIAIGFVGFAGNIARPCFLTDNVEIDSNTATIRDGDFINCRNDSRISQKTCAFVASARSITVTDANFYLDAYKVGKTIQIVGTASNNGIYTIATAATADDKNKILVTQSLVDETNTDDTDIYMLTPTSLKVRHNSVTSAGAGNGIRLSNSYAQWQLLVTEGNEWNNLTHAYRLDADRPVTDEDCVLNHRTRGEIYSLTSTTNYGTHNVTNELTDAENVESSGALMDSELAGIAAVKATTGTFLTADQTKLDIAVTKVSTPLNNQVGVWTGDGTLEGDADLVFDGTRLGIGTTVPLAHLTVNGGGSGDPATTGTVTTAHSRIYDSANVALDFGTQNNLGGSLWGSWIQCTDTGNLATEYVLCLQPNGGNLGIGTQSPTGLLDVAGDFVVASTGRVTVAKASNCEVDVITSSESITLDMNDADNFSLTLDHDTTFGDPSNLTAGQSGCIVITQGSGGTHTAEVYGDKWHFEGGTAPVLSTVAGYVDTLVYYVASTDSIQAVLLKDLK